MIYIAFHVVHQKRSMHNIFNIVRPYSAVSPITLNPPLNRMPSRIPCHVNGTTSALREWACTLDSMIVETESSPGLFNTAHDIEFYIPKKQNRTQKSDEISLILPSERCNGVIIL